MGNPLDEYVSTLLAQITDSRAQIDIKHEICQHLEEQINDYRKDGMNEEDAMRHAVEDMGDPVQTGVELNRIHRPKTAWGMIVFILIITFLVLGLKYSYYRFVLDSSVALHYLSKEFVFSCVGITLMLGINYLDYSVIGKYGRALTIFVLGGLLLVTCLFPAYYNGNRYICLYGGIVLNPGYIILLTVPLYGGILYAHRRGGWKSILICMVWAMLPGIILHYLSGTISTPLVLFGINILTLIIVASKGWFNIPAKKSITLLVSGMLGISAFYVLSCYLMGGYRKEMILAWFAPAKYETGYLLNNIRNNILLSKFIGINELADLSFQRQVLEYNIGEYLLSFMASYYGIIVMFLIIVVLIGLFSFIYYKIWKQKNLLGKLMGTSCCVILFMQTILYLLTNVGLLYSNYIGCPFINRSGSCTLVDYVFLGILLSIFRYRNVLPVSDSCNGAENVKQKRIMPKLIFNMIKIEE